MSKRVNEKKQANRVVREQIAREQARQRTMWISVVAVAALVIAGLIGWGVYASQKPTSFNTPKNAVADGVGFSRGDGPAKVEVYLDFMCPNCKAFEDSTASTLDQLIADKKITLINRPIAILDRASNGTQYSTRAAGASACAADDGKFPEFMTALYAKQPAENSSGLSDDELIQIGGSVGLNSPAFAKCVRDGKYKDWATHSTDESGKHGVNSTPSVYVNGKKVNATPDAIKAAVDAIKK